MKRLILIALALAVLVACGDGGGDDTTIVKKSSQYIESVAGFLNSPAYNSITYTGDSITYRCGNLYPIDGVIYRGIGGLQTAGLHNLWHDVLIKEQPSELWILIGINNLSHGNEADIIPDMAHLLGEISAQVYVRAITPTRNPDKNMIIDEQNKLIEALVATFEYVSWVDNNDVLEDAAGLLYAGYISNGVHLNYAGCKAYF